MARFLESYHQGLALYRERRLAESLAAFAPALEVRPGDAICQRYITLAQKHHETPPGEDWEAMTIMEGK